MAEAEAGLELPIGLTEQKFVQQLARIEARAIKAAKSAEQGFVRGNQAVANSFSRMSGAARGNLQNVSYQLQDIFVQISSGQGAARALGQQMPQLLSGFGALGAVLGLVASAAIPLAANFFATEDAAKALGDSIKSLNAAVDEYNRSAKDSSATAAELVSKFGSATAQAQDLYDRIARLKYIDAVDAVGAAISSLSSNFDDLQSYLNVLDAEMQQFGVVGPETEKNIAKQIAEDFGLTIEQARKFNDLLSDAQAAESVQEKARLLNEIAIYLDNAVQSTNNANQSLKGLARAAAEGALETYELAKSADQTSDAMQAASDAASTVAASVAGIDFSNAVAGANQLVAALQSGMAAIAAIEGQQSMATRRAQIARDFAGDKVGAAGATGALDFDTAYDAANPYQGPLTQAMQADIDARREAYVEGEKELARIQEETQARVKAISAAGSGGRKKGGAKEREPVNIFENAEQEVVNLERQIQLLGKGSEEAARMRAQWEMLDAAKRAGVSINDEINAKIAAQAAQVGRLTAELEQAEIAQEQFDQAVEGIANAFSNAILQGENLRDSLAQIFRQIAANILNAGIQQALAAAFGGGGSGLMGLIAAAFGGTKAAVPSFDGGGYTGAGARTGGLDGKGGFAAILHPNEIVVDRTRGQSLGGSQVVQVVVGVDPKTGNLTAFTDQRVARGVQRYDQQVPARMAQVSANPRRR